MASSYTPQQLKFKELANGTRTFKVSNKLLQHLSRTALLLTPEIDQPGCDLEIMYLLVGDTPSYSPDQFPWNGGRADCPDCDSAAEHMDSETGAAIVYCGTCDNAGEFEQEHPTKQGSDSCFVRWDHVFESIYIFCRECADEPVGKTVELTKSRALICTCERCGKTF